MASATEALKTGKLAIDIDVKVNCNTDTAIVEITVDMIVRDELNPYRLKLAQAIERGINEYMASGGIGIAKEYFEALRSSIIEAANQRGADPTPYLKVIDEFLSSLPMASMLETVLFTATSEDIEITDRKLSLRVGSRDDAVVYTFTFRSLLKPVGVSIDELCRKISNVSELIKTLISGGNIDRLEKLLEEVL